MVYAQILNGVIVNTVLIDDLSLLALFKCDVNGNPYDYLKMVEYAYPQPGIGWTFDGSMFYPPVPPPDNTDDGGS